MHEDITINFPNSTVTSTLQTSASTSWDTQPYSTKRHGLNLNNCDAEPVRTPGCIQAHGALLVLRLSDLSILQASENTLAILGQAASQLLGRSVAAVVKAEGEDRLRSLIANEPIDLNPIYAFTLPDGGQPQARHIRPRIVHRNSWQAYEPLAVVRVRLGGFSRIGRQKIIDAG